MKVEGDRLNALRDTFRECVEALCRQQAERLRQQAERLYRTRLVLTRQMDLVDRQAERLAVGLRQRLEREAARLRLMEQSVTLADPALILRRGFSITRVDGRAVTSAAAVAPGSHIETQLADGTITSVVSAGKQT
jgi:exodeoxyribonuclease VII large subunit